MNEELLPPPAVGTDLVVLDESDQMLLNHYVTNTGQTFSTDEDSKNVWQILVPRLAYEHAFLMHAVLVGYLFKTTCLSITLLVG